jgi:hypothetical protein
VDRTERLARAICEGRCLHAEIFNRPCVDPITHANAPCEATRDRLMLSWCWRSATNVLETENTER